jgi:hypothetical protein
MAVKRTGLVEKHCSTLNFFLCKGENWENYENCQRFCKYTGTHDNIMFWGFWSSEADNVYSVCTTNNELDLEMQQITYKEFQITAELHHTIFINLLLWYSMLSFALAEATVWPQFEDNSVQLALPLFIHWRHEHLPSWLGALWSRIAYLKDVGPMHCWEMLCWTKVPKIQLVFIDYVLYIVFGCWYNCLKMLCTTILCTVLIPILVVYT